MASNDPQTSAPGQREVAAVDEPFDKDGLYALRATLAAHAGRLGAPPAMIERLLIVAGELATNAVRHGGGSGRLRLWRTGDELRCEVSDHGPGIADPDVGHQLPGPTATSGRGMWICRRLCDDLIVDGDHHGAAVTAVLRIAVP